jgi:hypothetical protein
MRRVSRGGYRAGAALVGEIAVAAQVYENIGSLSAEDIVNRDTAMHQIKRNRAIPNMRLIVELVSRQLARTPAVLFHALALARFLGRPTRQSLHASVGDDVSLHAILELGDVLLTEGNTRMAALVRRLTRSAWAHVSIYVGPLGNGPDPCCVVEADVAAGVRAVPLSEFKGQRVRVLRPRGLPVAVRHSLVAWVLGRIGNAYDLRHALTLAGRLLRMPWISRASPTPSDANRFVCSTLLARAFLLVGHPIVPHMDVTPRDFESASIFEVAA